MKNLALISLFFVGILFAEPARPILSPLFSIEAAEAAVRVSGYYRKNGTYVAPHYRSNPDGNPYNNWSYPGNTNLYTGRTATGNPSTYLNNYYKGGSSYTPSIYALPSYIPSRGGSLPASLLFDSQGNLDATNTFDSCKPHGKYKYTKAGVVICECERGYWSSYGKCIVPDGTDCGYTGTYNVDKQKCDCNEGYLYRNGKCQKPRYCGLNGTYNWDTEQCDCASGYQLQFGYCSRVY